MNNFAVEIWDDTGESCTFYTVRWLDSELSETDKFFEKYDALEDYSESANKLFVFVSSVVGEDYGAIDKLFNRHENEVVGLPTQGRVHLGEILYYPDFPLRLYALRINENIVVLFNGGIKDATTNQKASLLPQWREACLFARKINEAIREEMIIVDIFRRKLLWHNHSAEIILP